MHLHGYLLELLVFEKPISKLKMLIADFLNFKIQILCQISPFLFILFLKGMFVDLVHGCDMCKTYVSRRYGILTNECIIYPTKNKISALFVIYSTLITDKNGGPNDHQILYQKYMNIRKKKLAENASTA